MLALRDQPAFSSSSRRGSTPPELDRFLFNFTGFPACPSALLRQKTARRSLAQGDLGLVHPEPGCSAPWFQQDLWASSVRRPLLYIGPVLHRSRSHRTLRLRLADRLRRSESLSHLLKQLAADPQRVVARARVQEKLSCGITMANRIARTCSSMISTRPPLTTGPLSAPRTRTW